jgi:hypothetical protein
MVVYNPYGAEAKKRRAFHARVESPPPTRRMALDVLMEGARVASKTKKQCADMAPQPREATLVAKAAAKARNSTKRKRNNEKDEKENSNNDENEEEDEESGKALGDWSDHTWTFLQSFANCVTESVFFEQRGRHELVGSWPFFHMAPVVDPSADPIQFRLMFDSVKKKDIAKKKKARNINDINDDDDDTANDGNRKGGSLVARKGGSPKKKARNINDINDDDDDDTANDGNRKGGSLVDRKGGSLLDRGDFALPNVMVWGPERRFPQLYPHERPACKFHAGNYSCVRHLGISHYPRRCYGARKTTAVYPFRYECEVRRKQNENTAQKLTYTFHSTDPEVIAAAPPYVQAQWREHGFCLTFKGGVSYKLIDQGRALLANGAGASGFVRMIKESYQQRHHHHGKMWRSYVNHSKNNDIKRKKRSLYFDSDDPRAELRAPSLTYMLKVILSEIELRIPYYTARMQMVFGKCLSADHSHKVAKVVLIAGERAFEGIYTVMNEFGKVLGFWFVNGTTLAEVEIALRGIDARYNLNGLRGPELFTTDRCCDEREFFEGTGNHEKKPIFSSFASSEPNSMLQVGQVEVEVGGEVGCEADSPKGQVTEKKYLTLAKTPIVVSTHDVAEATVATIVRMCKEKSWDCIAIDSEWEVLYGVSRQQREIRKRLGPDVFQVGLPDGSTFVFKIRSYGRFPPALKKLLESENIKKVAHTISADASRLGEVGVVLAAGINLPEMAKQRGVVPRANNSLATVVQALFSCDLKKGSVRTSDWASNELTEEQRDYAALDAYAHMFCYLKLAAMPYVDPKAVPAPKIADVPQGTKVLLYNDQHSQVLASGSVVRQACGFALGGHIPVVFKDKVVVQVSQSDVRVPAAVAVESPLKKSFGQIFEDTAMPTAAPDAAPTLEITWKLHDTRLEAEEQGDGGDPITVAIKTISIPTPAPVAPVPVAVPENFESDDADTSDDDIENDEHALHPPAPHTLPLTLDNKGSRVKQDIVHIFLRFSRVLKKAHGAFALFMARLSDVFFIPSQDDLELIKDLLKQNGFSDDQIKQKTWQYFKRRVRRSVPPPNVLERDFNRTVNMFANLKDAKTGKQLFGKKAWNLYSSTLKHIKKGCLSDIEGLTYYVQIGEDSMGIPLFKCVRGTNGVEGFHQKIRQLVRGFNVSPRFAITLLHEFIARWNHDIDVRILGLPRKYANFYDGWVIEDEIKEVVQWGELNTIVHGDWNNTKDFVCPDEAFGLIHRKDIYGSYDDMEKGLEEEVTKVVDAMNDGTLYDDDDEQGTECLIASTQVLTASAAWVGKKLGCHRGVGGVETEMEKHFFLENYHRYQNDCSTADNYSSINFAKLATMWNETIVDEEAGNRPKTDMKLKNSFLLLAYWKDFKVQNNRTTTCMDVDAPNKAFRRELRYGARQPVPPSMMVQDYAKSAVAADDSTFVMSMDDEEGGSGTTGAAAHAESGSAMASVNFGASISAVAAPKRNQSQRKQSRLPRRCRQCGHSFASGHTYHWAHVGFGGGVAPNDVCQVPPGQRVKNFPVPRGHRVPRQSRAKP